ncbi:MAG: Lrp/AsnC family transcriptional regulator [Thermomicrobiales bacterium]|nr:Lrp/AsnC family transcriptional regulator [Thermomicrobiales bacterium]
MVLLGLCGGRRRSVSLANQLGALRFVDNRVGTRDEPVNEISKETRNGFREEWSSFGWRPTIFRNVGFGAAFKILNQGDSNEGIQEMTASEGRLIDSLTWDLLRALDENARMSYKELACRVGLSAPAVADRLRRLEDAGIIRGYRVELNPERLGMPVHAILRMSKLTSRCTRVADVLLGIPEILECHRVTGADAFYMQVSVASIGHLEELVDRLMPYGQITTSLVFSSPVQRRTLSQPSSLD